MGKALVIAAIVLFIGVKEIESTADAIRVMASGFLTVLDECKHELNLTDHIISDLYRYWKLDYSLLGRDTGCAIICMSKKLDLLDSSGKLHHGNAQEFAVKHGAADDEATQLVTMIHGCEKQYEGIEDDCMRVLDVAKCFRTGIHELKWTPTVDVIVTEVLTEI